MICTSPTGRILEIVITAYFDWIVRKQLMEMIEKRVSDGSALRLVPKWIQLEFIDPASVAAVPDLKSGPSLNGC